MITTKRTTAAETEVTATKGTCPESVALGIEVFLVAVRSKFLVSPSVSTTLSSGNTNNSI